jgi:hypothetical protein
MRSHILAAALSIQHGHTGRLQGDLMARLSATLVVFTASLLAGCMGQLSAGTGIQLPAAVMVDGESAPELPMGPVYAPGEDVHWMQPADYFVSEDEWTQDWIYVHLGKMQQPPAPGSKGQAMFFRLHDSRDVWTRHYWKTRPAAPGELVVGALAICFDDNKPNNVYRAPTTKGDARTGDWFLGKITDVSDAYKHQVRISTYDCDLDAVRIVGR